ncbi:MAG: 2-succinyl-5-enolpyruvyl-6-hydroxy-3-cyclohexene-1-carboxylate synthase [Bifidobacterium tibiigranuli]|jgi:2-succinyl-5-enolpyruvyl-6-hydroxy-3-cyclohexene-1-carboxylate synthase|uniref:thiamine pyrophosphate-binding protein n=1 Tax=Bifidobacterium tibiigranuli TaxID=2172043 RepID=UPI002357AE06|nr:thiamine pyrophosphate-binding protein [Bifidobacterium tibiigranuli]MCH3975188.1 2-succinyl-5-enolpyruvyl-6-hydroxy-3-cyclohexene-1-carboxylate synthase [Bifidobacterium tibiigranuli]MCH4203386.1 2-succinyl-5-enolpyruvyl-6-hydroxy-3-cyclohexene-1-carboxylate synthase [Bifidobacterium tibiigranuli]MCH4274002.1 2-succinyl-5-enolpyruvyl-6-hydroxy-3-cyclohexene-1-carboxylate synthase [Bifidobacterium tibiigranuli]
MAAIKHTNERNAQIVISLLKQHGVRKVIVSPGTTNLPIVYSVQKDSFFEVYSSVDERSAAYMACGMSATSGEPVALSCTGATASRNYLPGLTEAFYRKLPVIAITSFNGNQNIGQLLPQTMDRTQIQNDVALVSVDAPVVKDEQDALYCNRVVNQALLECTRDGGGPVHINLATGYDNSMGLGAVPKSRLIQRYFVDSPEVPPITRDKKVVVLVGAHNPFDEKTEASISSFAQTHNAVVMCDHTSNYHGFGRLLATLSTDNLRPLSASWGLLKPDLVISIGEISGDYATADYLQATHAESWRVSPDGEIRDRFGTLTNVFQCSVASFFNRYSQEHISEQPHTYFAAWNRFDESMRRLLPELPFSNRWIAQQLAPQVPASSIMHFAILNSLRSWNYCEIDESIRCFCNTGGFGIDGALSTLLGSALAEPDTLHFACVGDLAFFYDMNALGNRELSSNIRILLINNKVGDEMHMPYASGYVLKDEGLDYVCAKDHFQSRTQVSGAQAWSEAMGFTYISAVDKQSFLDQAQYFVDPNAKGPMVFECFTTAEDDSATGRMLQRIDPVLNKKEDVKAAIKKVVPHSIIRRLKNV